MYCDHINGDGLDNRRSNLRIASPSQNVMNQKKRTKTSSKFKGCYLEKSTNKWVARITVNYKNIIIGRFKDELKASFAYDEKAKELFGEFAKLNH